MRWPFRRKRETAPPDPPGMPAVTGATGNQGRRPVRHWAALPVIPVTINLGAPLVAGPAPVLPPLRPAAGKAADVASPTGTVTGITRLVPMVSEPVPEQAPAAPLPPPPVVRRAARAVPVETPVLTDAVDEYVGEPRVAAEPHRAPSWLRFATNPGVPVLPGLPGPEPEPPVTEPREAPEQPPRMVEGVERAGEAAQRPMRKRRPSLGQSRRLGLGAPIPAPEREDLIHPEAPPPVVDGTVESATSQEPPPPPAAPVHVAAEPAPEPEPEPEPAPEPKPAPPSASTPRTVRPNPPGDRPAPDKRTVATSYRATAELLPPRLPRQRPRAAVVVDAVPPDLAHAVRARQHADVANVPVYRGPKVSEAAKARGAKAFASRGAVFLPDEAGPTDSPKARGLLAHELVHTVQQRTLGPVLPAPDSPLGQRLEAEAQAAERFYGGEPGADEPAPLIHAPLPATPPAQEAEPDLSSAAQLAIALASSSPASAPATPRILDVPFDQATRGEVDKIATESAKHVVAEWTNPHLQKKSGNTVAAAATTLAVASAFDRGARREQLVQQRLDALNQTRYADQLTELDPAELESIDHILDAEEGAATGAITQTTPAGPVYARNSKEAWLHAITGMNAEYGLGLTGFRETPGTEKSWFRERTDEEREQDGRPRVDRLLDATGLSSVEAENQFDTDTWFQEKDSAGQAPHEEWKYGKPNPDGAMVDVSRLDLDELANRLYDRVRSRLRIELLVDRERAGLLTDFR